MNRHLFTRIMLIAIAALAMAACSTGRKAVSTTPAGEASQWQRVKVPANIRIGAPLNVSAGATVSFVRDTSATISARFLGMEVFLLHATNDTVMIVDKMHRQYIAESLTAFMAHMPFTISTVQDLLTGIPVTIPHSALPPGIGYTAEQADGLMTSLTVTRPGAEPVEVTYGDPVNTPFGPRPASTRVTAPVKDKTYTLTIDWSWGKAKWDSDVEDRAIRLSGSYRKINPADISKAIK